MWLLSFILQREGTSTRNISALGRAAGSLGGTEQAELHSGGSILSCGSCDTGEVLFGLMQNRSIAVALPYNPLPPGEGKAACCRAGTPVWDFTGEAAPAFPIPRRSSTGVFHPLASCEGREKMSKDAGFSPCLAPGWDAGESWEIPNKQSSSGHLQAHIFQVQEEMEVHPTWVLPTHPRVC